MSPFLSVVFFALFPCQAYTDQPKPPRICNLFVPHRDLFNPSTLPMLFFVLLNLDWEQDPKEEQRQFASYEQIMATRLTDGQQQWPVII